ncbi:MAG: MltA domain-containing protein [Pseudomonadota bacterium]|nr:MltA domain-containing protein [Pseudomonadota bacterium]
MRIQRRYAVLMVLCLLLFSLVAFVVYLKASVPTRVEDVLRVVPKDRWPLLEDDLDLQSLCLALECNLVYLNKLPGKRTFTYGSQVLSVDQVLVAQVELVDFIKQKPSEQEIVLFLKKKFKLLESVSRSRLPWRKKEHPVLFTGYYVPTLRGSRQPDGNYRYPLYKKPADLVAVDLGKFNLHRWVRKLWPWLAKLPFGPRLEELRFPSVRGRLIKSGKVVPYHTRAEIDCEGKLCGQNLELIWVDDEIDRFFLQIQGSGLVRLADGQTMMVGYAAANGHPYRSIGGWLIRQGLMKREEVSMPSIRAWIKENPERIKEIFRVNPSYVFFRELPTPQALGCYGVPITSGRSIATDRKLFPSGALALIMTELPIFSLSGELTGWRSCSRLVLNQDTGGAIKGPYRVDLYCGEDEPAELTAGVMKQPGRLFFFVPR